MSVSRLIRAFSARHTAPVQTDEVLEVLKAWGVRDEIWFFEVEMDTGIMKGQVAEWEAPWDDGTTRRFADISTAKGLSTSEKRLVQCKELLHLIDPDWARVSDEDAIMDLINEVVAPPDTADPYGEETDSADADNRTIWSALAVLFPWQVREVYLPAYRLRLIGDQQIAELLDLPTQHVTFVMSDKWPEVYAKMTDARFVPVYDEHGQVLLYDIFVGEKWIGSKRTLDQCEDRIRFLSAG